ncbi:hypothetical protein ACXR8U_32915 (plasmid) [Methylobacterium radiotolerans]|jgi:hypothetical protein
MIYVLACAALVLGSVVSAQAQTPPITPDPERFRPLSYADLRHDRPEIGTFREIWADVLVRNNAFYERKGDLRYVGGVAPATEAHFIVWSPTASVVYSVLNAASECERLAVSTKAAAIVKRCPMRVAFYADGRKRVTSGPKVCFLELNDADLVRADPYRSVAYARYDPSTKHLSVGLSVDRSSVDGCAFEIPLTDDREPERMERSK